MGNSTLRRAFLAGAALVLAAPTMMLAQVSQQKIVILMLGGPGSGKTTQAKNLSGKYKVPSYSMATIFKKESGWVKDKYKKSLGVPMATGEVLNDEISNQLVEKYITRKKAQNGFILDGYPRTAQQAKYFDDTLKVLGLPEPVIIHLSISEELARQRLASRGGKQDKPEMIDQRMADYRAEKDFLIGHYEGRLRNIDGTPGRGAVWSAIQKAMKGFE